MVFVNQEWNKKLTEEGYIIAPVLDNAAITALTNLFNAIPQHQAAFTTFAIEDYAIRKQVDTAIKAALQDFCKQHFTGYVPFWGNFFVKPPQTPAMPLHADLQYVNEPQFISLNIWCPLQDVTADNGGLGIVPYSHHAIRQIRGTNITRAFRVNNDAIQQQLGKTLTLKAGEAIIYDHRLLHYSTANNSAQKRLAITLIMVPEQAQLVHYYAATENDTNFEQYAIGSVEDFLRAPFNQRFTHLNPVAHIQDYSFKPVSIGDIQRHMPRKNILQRFFNFHR